MKIAMIKKTPILFFVLLIGFAFCLPNGFADENGDAIDIEKIIAEGNFEFPIADGGAYIQGNAEFQKSPEHIIGTPDFEKMRDLPEQSRDYQLGTKVGWIRIPTRDNPNRFWTCTGFLVGPDLFMTNHHCLHDDVGLLSVEDARIYMDYYQDQDVDPTFGGITAGVAEILRMDAPKDYALLRLDAPIGNTYGWLQLDRTTRVNSSQSVKLISHNRGRSKEIVRRNTQIVDIPARHPLLEEPFALVYLADSEPGSSGSPVFLRDGTGVIAINHSGWASGGGVPQFNAGSLMSYIVPEIEQWLPGGPRTVRLFYFLPTDRPYRQTVVDRMKTGMLQVQSFYADQMEAHGHGRKTFQIETDGQGTPIVHRVDGDHPDSYYKSTGIPGDEIRRAVDTSSIVQLIVMDISRSSGGNGIGIKEKGRAVVHGNWDWSTAAHALGHAFGLQHDFREGAHVMSYGNRGALSEGAAHFLAVNPYFNNSVRLQAEAAPSVELLSPTNYWYGVIGFVIGQPLPRPPLHVPVTLRVRDPDGIQQVTLFIKTPDRTSFTRPSGFLEVIEYRNLSGETDATVTFNYEGNTPSFGDTDLLNTLKHTIYVSAVDRQGNRIDHPHSWTLQAVNVPKPEVPLSDRSPRVAESIYNVVHIFDDPSVSSHDDITTVHLANITNMNVLNIRASDSALRANDFDGLTGLSRLELRLASGYSENTVLPAGIFEGLTSLSSVQFKYYPDTYGADPSLYPMLPFPVGLKRVGEGQFKAVVHTGAPFDMDLPLIVVNGSIDGGATRVTIPAGSVESDVLTVTRTPGTTAAVVVDLERTVENPGTGYAFYKSSYHLELLSPLAGAPTPVTERTPQVLDAIVGEVPEINHIHHDRDLRYIVDGQFVDKKYNTGFYVSEAHLAALTRLDVSGGSEFLLSGGSEVQQEGNWFSLLGDATELRAGDFDGMRNLTSLRLENNELSALPDGIFDKLTDLTYLNLSGNALTTLPAGLFDKLTNLTTLGIRSNALHALPAGIFDKLTNLTTLNLSGNALTTLPAGLFDELTNLTYLNLLDNPLHSLPQGYFDNLTNLTTLLLPPIITPPTLPTGTAITPVANRTPQVRDAIVAAAGVNAAADVTAAHLAAITELDLSESGLTALKSGDFNDLFHLEGLAIGGEFRALSAGIFDHLVNLKALGIVSTRLGALPNGIFDHLLSLQLLVIGGIDSDELGSFLSEQTELGSFPNDQTELRSVRTEKTPLRLLPDGIFDNLVNLKLLYIVNTELRSLPAGIFDYFTNLPLILLSNNQLSSLPDGIFDKATMILDLSNNQLSSLPDGIFAGIFDEPPDLTGFYLFGAPLGPIPADRLADLGEYTTLILTGNPGAPLPLTVSLERVGTGQFKAVAPAGAPFELVLPIKVANGTINEGATSITIPVGGVESDIFTVTPTPGATFAVSVDIQTLPALWSNHSGYTLVKSANLPLVFTEFGGVFSIRERTPEVRDAIVEAADVNSVDEVTEAHLAAITELFLDPLDSVKVGDFDGLTALTELGLRTRLTSLPDGLFDDLSNVTTMEWIDLNLSTLPPGVFDSFVNLTTLVMEARSLSSLPAGVFDNLTNLTYLGFHALQLSSLPADPFDNLANLTILDFHTGQLTSLPDELFSGLTSLTTLGLSGNAVNPMPLTVSLEKVAGGQFKAVSPTGAPFDIVLPLTVSDGTISGGATTATIPKGSVGSEILTVTRTPTSTYPTTVNIGTLPGVPTGHTGYTPAKSSHLPLIFNELGGIFPVSQRTPQVRDAIVAAAGVNSASDLTEAHLAAITRLDLSWDVSRQKITSLKTGDFFGLSSLKVLWLSHNSLTSLPEGIFDGLSSVEQIDLLYNNINSIPSNMFERLTSLKHLDLQGNRLTSISKEWFDDLSSLESLSFKGNSLTELPMNVFGRLTSLKSLNLVSNSLTSLSVDVFEGLSTLTHLDLRNASLTSLPADIFDGLSSLIWLDLGYNNLLSLPDGIFDGLSSLTTLTLSGNTVDPMPLTVSLEKVGRDAFKAAAPTGAPFDIVLPISVTNGSIGTGTTTLTISKGSVESDILTVTRLPGTNDAVTVDIGTLPSLPQSHQGYALHTSADLPLEVISTGTLPNQAPVFTEGVSTTRTVVENAPFGINIGAAVAATDADNDTLTYMLSGTDASAFNIDSATGQLKTWAALDYETKNAYSVTISTSDGYGGNDSITVAITVVDVTETPIMPVSTRTQQVQNAIVAAVPGVTNAADVTAAHLAAITTLPLGYQSITSLKSGDFDGFTSLTTLQLQNNAISDISVLEHLTSLTTLNLGSNSISDISALEHLTHLKYLYLNSNSVSDVSVLEHLTSLTVLYLQGNTISDYGPLRRLKTNNPDLYIDININVNNNAPVFTEGTSTTRAVAENTVADTDIGTAVAATDADNDVLTYTLGGTDAAAFSIVSTTGQLQTKAALDYETKVSYTATLFATDGNGGADSITVTITVTDVNEDANNAPVFTDGTSTTRSIAENTASGTNIGTAIAATDPDTGDVLTYSLGGTDAASFGIVSTSGQLQTSAALDYETQNSYSVTVSVSDGNGGSDSIDVTINVTDVDENTIDPPLSERTPQVRDAIVAAAGVNSVDDVTAAHLAAITFLELSGASISSLKAGDFNGLTALQELGLGDNNLSSLPSGIFDNLANLTWLDLARNALASLPSGILDDLTALTQLHLEDNALSTLPSGIFDNNTKLTRLELESNALSALPSGIFDNLTVLTELGLGHNNLSSFPAALDGLTALKVLSLYDNNLSSLSSDTFDNLTTLTELYLVNNSRLSSLPSGVFDNLTALTTLRLDNTGLSSLPSGIFDELTALEGLGLGDNNLSSLPSGIFDDLTVLTYLALNDNQISDVSELEGLTSLTALYLRGNPISDYGPLRRLKAANPNISIDISLNNNPPQFTDGTSTTRSIAENTASGTNIGTAVSATDADNHFLSYSLSGTDAESFSIVSTSGQLQTSAALDYETKNAYSVTVSVSDGHDGWDRITVTINVTDVNEDPNNAPVFTDGTSTTRSIAENTASGTNIGTAVAATDADNDTLTYTLSGTDAAAFSIVSTTGQLQTNAALDYETKTSYSVTITVSDGSLTDSITVTINVTDVNETPPTSNTAPVFAQGVSIPNISATAGTAITPVILPEATDADGDTITYTLTPALPAGLTFNASTRALTGTPTAAVASTVYTYTASDGTGSAALLFFITVNAAPTPTNSPPDFASGATIDNIVATVGTAIAGIFLPEAIDPDGDSVNYTISPALPSGLVFNLTTRTLTGTPAAAMAQTAYTYTATAIGGTDTLSFFITVNAAPTPPLPANNAPVFTDGTSTTRSVAENTASGQNIGTAVAATDADTGDTLTYTLGGTDAASFSIVSTSGQLQTNAALDYETKTSYSVTVSVSDGNGGTDSITVTINVTDVDENTIDPPLSDRTQQVRDAIVAAAGVESADDVTPSHLAAISSLNFHDKGITSLKAGDFDGITKLRLLYLSFNSLDPLPSGIFDNNTQLTILDLQHNGLTSLPSDIFDNNTQLITLVLSYNDISDVSELESLTWLDNLALSGNPISDYGPLRSLKTAIEAANSSIIIDINLDNNLPVFSDGDSTTRSVAENTATGTNIGTAVSATDADDHTLTYTLGGTDAESFSIVNASGQLQTKAALDYETKSSYEVTVTAYDGNSGGDRITVTINVTDVNEGANNAPVFTDGTSTTRTIAENTASEQNIGSAVGATDADSGDTLTYTLSGTDEASFSIVSTSGQLQTKAALNYETKTSYSVKVSVSDGNGGTDSINVTVNVTNVNEAPAFSVGASISNISATKDTAITSVTLPAATDVDANTTITYTLTPALPAGLTFTASTRILAGTPTAEKAETTYTYKASDGALSDTLTFTIQVSAPANNAPAFSAGASISNISATVGTAITSVTLPEATDADGDTITYTLTPALPAGLTFTASTRILSGTPTTATASATYTYKASDGTDSDTLTFKIVVKAAAPDPPLSERTPQVRDAIVAAVPGITNVADVTAAHLAAITMLSIGTSSTSLKSGDFSGLSSLTTLNIDRALNDHTLESLPSDVFDGLSSLTTLRIYSHSNLSNLPSDIFDELSSLTYLRLSTNGLTSSASMLSLW